MKRRLRKPNTIRQLNGDKKAPMDQLDLSRQALKQGLGAEQRHGECVASDQAA